MSNNILFYTFKFDTREVKREINVGIEPILGIKNDKNGINLVANGIKLRYVSIKTVSKRIKN